MDGCSNSSSGVVCAIAFRRLGNHAEAQEVCQEVFIQAMRKIGQLRDPRCFAGWLRSMANRMSLNRAVRGQRMPVVPESFEVASTAQQTPLGDMLKEESRAQVHSGLDRLSTMDRETLVAFYFDGRSLNEMSDRVPHAGGHDQAAAARRPQAAGPRAGRDDGVMVRMQG